MADDARIAQLLALVADANRDPSRRRRPCVPTDLLLQRRPRAEVDQASLRTGIDAAMAAFGGLRR